MHDPTTPAAPLWLRLRAVLDEVYTRVPVDEEFDLHATLADMLAAVSGELRAPRGDGQVRLALVVRQPGRDTLFVASSRAVDQPPPGSRTVALEFDESRAVLHADGLDDAEGARLLPELGRTLAPLVRSALLHRAHLEEIRRLRRGRNGGNVLERDLTLREMSRVYAEALLDGNRTKTEVCRILGITDKTLNRILRGE